MESAFIIPNKGAMVRDPNTKEPLPIHGKTVTLLGTEGRYWRRRIRDKAVKIGSPSVAPEIKKSKDKREFKRNKGE